MIILCSILTLEKEMPMKEISALELRKKFGETIDRIRYQKELCVITKNGRPVIVLVDFDVYRTARESFKDEAFIEDYTEDRIKEFLSEDKLDRATAETLHKKLKE